MKYGLGALAVVLLVWFDQWTKQLAQKSLMSGPYVIWDGVFELRYSINKGAAFGIMFFVQPFLADTLAAMYYLLA